MILSSKEILLLERIKDDESYNQWFFSEAKELKWFFPLKERGYFNLGNISFTLDNHAQFWNVLPYLERVSMQINTNKEYAIELLTIIKNAIRYSTTEKRIDNYYFWWYC